MNKIGTITFHWATNYGAVMQAYALQKFIKNLGYETEIIDYEPNRVKSFQFLSNLKSINFSFFKKEKSINKFRKKELTLSKKRYGTNKELFQLRDCYTTIICGSDQIWNEFFTTRAEGKPTLSYFLNFARDTKKVAYAVSFGTNSLCDEVKHLILPELKQFHKIGVRENTGKVILNGLDINSTVVLDPTFLLSKNDYNQLIKQTSFVPSEKVFTYIIHNNQSVAIGVSDYVKSKYNEYPHGKYYNIDFGLYEWLYKIQNAEVVVTNSFHGVAFAIIFNTPFIVIPVEGAEMNDRIYTLLSALNLQNRIVSTAKFDTLDTLLSEKIDWKSVEVTLNALKRNSVQFLLEALSL